MSDPQLIVTGERITGDLPLRFPLLMSWGNCVLRISGREFLNSRVKKHLGGNRFLLTHGASPRLRVHWVIDREGVFRFAQEVRTRREWARPLASLGLVDLVLVEVEFESGRAVLVSELIEILRNSKSPREFRTATDLRSFLKSQQTNATFDRTMFSEFWAKHGPKLQPEQWLLQFPLTGQERAGEAHATRIS